MCLSGQIQTRRQSHGIMRFSLSDGENLKIPAGSRRAGFTCSEEMKAPVKEMSKVLTALTPSHTSALRRLLFQAVAAALMKLNYGAWSSSCRQQRGRRPGRGQARLRRPDESVLVLAHTPPPPPNRGRSLLWSGPAEPDPSAVFSANSRPRLSQSAVKRCFHRPSASTDGTGPARVGLAGSG